MSAVDRTSSRNAKKSKAKQSEAQAFTRATKWEALCLAGELIHYRGSPFYCDSKGRVYIPYRTASRIIDVLFALAVDHRGRPIKESTIKAERLLRKGISKEQIGKMIAQETGEDRNNVTRRLRAMTRQEKAPRKK